MTTSNGNSHNAREHLPLLGADALLTPPHILIAEDQPVIQELLRYALQLAGYRTTVCGGRCAALTWKDRLMHAGDARVVLLLDLSLLDTNEATDFLRQVRARWQDASGVLPQVIVLTTSLQVQQGLELRELVLQKPFHVRDLLALIQQAIAVVSRSEDGSEQVDASLWKS